MKPGLSDRLSRLKKAQKQGVKPTPAPGGQQKDKTADSSAAIPFKGEWKAAGPDLWIKTRICPSPLINFHSSDLLLEEYPPQEEWLFYDTETTGLSGGAGNTAFLVGVGRPEGKDFRITQYFLRDYPGEPLMLDHLEKEIQKSSLFISFNGKSFDKPLLETRFLMNRMHCRMRAQLDLLYPMRSLFKGMYPDCRLGTVEEEFLDIRRQGDIPGAEIPDIWFSFLKNGSHPDMDRVMEHNDMDIHSLALLLRDLESFLINGGQKRPYDSFSLGRFYMDRGDERGEEYLRKAAAENHAGAVKMLSQYWKRQGQWDKAVALWEGILERRLSPFAGIEMAKYREHRLKDIGGALTLCETMLRELPLNDQRLREELLHRYRRLQKKMTLSGKQDCPEGE